MARSQPLIPVSAKMYKHFAMTTVCITALLAIFADGSNREAIGDHLESQRQQAEMRSAEQDLTAQHKGGRTAFRDNRRVKGSFGVETGGGSSEGDFSNTGYSTSYEGYDFADVPPPAADGMDSGEGETPMLAASTAAPVPAAPGRSTRIVTASSAGPPPGMTREEWEQIKRQAQRDSRATGQP